MAKQTQYSTPIRLNDDNLTKLPKAIKRPSYDREKLAAGIVHIGLGNFHRAHQAWYLHRLMQRGEALNFAIIGAGVRPNDKEQREKLAAQDYLTTLIELDPTGISAEVIGSMIDYVPVEEENQALIERMSMKDIRIVSLTVTEGGYYLDAATNGFDAVHPDIQHDATNPARPKTAFGAMVAALKIRRDRGFGPFTGLSCDNIQGNGNILRQTVVSLARLSDPELAHWIDQNCTFPNSMVDCIVPSTGPAELEIARSFGINDTVPVTHERFRQWVLEDEFCAGRPDWNEVGATFTANVHDYEAMKIRILNGGHQIIATAGEILSYETIADCMSDEFISRLLVKVTTDEIAPHLDSVPEITTDSYIELIKYRFSNPRIVDTTRRVAFDGSSRHPGFLLPSIRDALAAGTPIEGLALVEAMWARMCEGSREDGSTIAANDPLWDELQQAAKKAKASPILWLEQGNIYGDLAKNTRFTRAFSQSLTMIWSEGINAAMKHYLLP